MSNLSIIRLLILFILSGLLLACGPIKTTVTNQYQLDCFSKRKLSTHKTSLTLYITPPEATAGFQTEQMKYVKKPYELSSFVKSTWTNPPAEMIYPLMIQSIQHTQYFKAVASGAYAENADYRLDTQILRVQQNFLVKPSILNLEIKIVLTRANDNTPIASRIITESVACSADNPYGGVVAANRATRQFTAILADFVIKQVQIDRKHTS